jgi:hypothetical protein
MLLLFICCCLNLPCKVSGTNLEVSDTSFEIYILKKRYNAKVQRVLSHFNFRTIKLLGGYMIDPDKKGIIDTGSVRRYLLELFPNFSDSGTLCINLENKLYKDLRDFDFKDKQFQNAQKAFLDLIRFIKKLRPRIKCGIYGLPFRVYYKSQEKWNENNKFSYIFREVDIIFPSLYILYPDQQYGENANNEYWKFNLKCVFEYDRYFRKPIIPFVWYMVNPGNKIFGGSFLKLNELERYIEFLKNYEYDSRSISGIVWWEPSKRGFQQIAKDSTLNQSDLFLFYLNLLKGFISKVK